jgi:puromycin-sensitive aminopeptidase
LELAGGFGSESDHTVWATLAGALRAIDHHILDDASRPHFRPWAGALLGSALDRLGWQPQPDDDERARQTRGLVITLAGALADDDEVIARSREVHDSYLRDPATIDPDVAAAVLAVVTSHGRPDDYDTVLERYRSSASPQEAERYLYALARFPGPDQARRTLVMTLTDDIRSQSAPYVLGRLLANRDAGPEAWAFVEANWDAIGARFPDNAIPGMLAGTTALSTPTVAERVDAFLAEHPVPQGGKTIDQHRERLRVNVALRAREAGPVAGWLADWSA